MKTYKTKCYDSSSKLSSYVGLRRVFSAVIKIESQGLGTTYEANLIAAWCMGPHSSEVRARHSKPEVKGSIPDTVKRLFRSTALEHKRIVVLATQYTIGCYGKAQKALN